MTMTTEAMKQAQHLLRWTHFGECRTYPGPVPEAREVDKLLTEAIATEEAQGVELVMTQKEMRVMGSGALIWIDLERLHPSWVSETGRTRQLFTRPAPPPADHIGAATKLVGERAALIEKLKWAAKVGGDAILHVGGADTHKKAADMLAADAQEVERKYISPVRTIADLVNNLLLMDQALPIYGAQYIDHPTRGRCAIAVSPTVSRERVQDSRWIGQGNELNAAIVWTRAAQQAAVPQEPTHYADSTGLLYTANRAEFLGLDKECLMALYKHAAPQPLQADAPADNVEDARAMVPMTPEQISDTYQKATGQTLRPCDKHAVETLTREIEAHHEIGVKP